MLAEVGVQTVIDISYLTDSKLIQLTLNRTCIETFKNAFLLHSFQNSKLTHFPFRNIQKSFNELKINDIS